MVMQKKYTWKSAARVMKRLLTVPTDVVVGSLKRNLFYLVAF